MSFHFLIPSIRGMSDSQSPYRVSQLPQRKTEETASTHSLPKEGKSQLNNHFSITSAARVDTWPLYEALGAKALYHRLLSTSQWRLRTEAGPVISDLAWIGLNVSLSGSRCGKLRSNLLTFFTLKLEVDCSKGWQKLNTQIRVYQINTLSVVVLTWKALGL